MIPYIQINERMGRETLEIACGGVDSSPAHRTSRDVWARGECPIVNRSRMVSLSREDNKKKKSVKVRSHQTRMKHYAQIIYMLSQCKDAIDNPAELFERFAPVEKSALWRIFAPR